MSRSDCRPVPADFAEVAPTMSWRALVVHYRTGGRIVRRWLNETGITPGKTIPRKRGAAPPPADFAEIAPTMALRGLAAHYGVSRDTASRWCKEIGDVRTRVPKPKNPSGGMIFRGHPGFRVDRTDIRRKDEHDEAADIIRRVMPVFRCNERGTYEDKGKLWRVGNAILTGDELLQRADKYRRAAA